MRPAGLASSPPAAIGLRSQGELVTDHWFSALDLSEGTTGCTHIAGTRLTSAPRNGLMLTDYVFDCLCLVAERDPSLQLDTDSFTETMSDSISADTIELDDKDRS